MEIDIYKTADELEFGMMNCFPPYNLFPQRRKVTILTRTLSFFFPWEMYKLTIFLSSFNSSTPSVQDSPCRTEGKPPPIPFIFL